MSIHSMSIHTFASHMKLETEIKQKAAFRSESEKLLVNLMFTSGWLSGHQQKFFKPYGLSVQQYNILRILRGQQNKPLGIQAITERMLDKMSNSSRLVDKLKEKGLVIRKVCPTDRRQVEVSLTLAGLLLLEEIDSHFSQMDDITSCLNQEEMRQLNTLLDKLRG